jgi:MerR family transcriptional regulator, thiopeptide resistance regulator
MAGRQKSLLDPHVPSDLMTRSIGEDGAMKLITVKALARLSGISVRTLHHYDQIGLLKPASVGANGYRYYGREEMLRLQQILFHRELEFPLEAIAEVLARPDFDRVGALRRHREKLSGQLARYRRLLKTLDRTLAALEGETDMDDKELYRGFSPEKQAEFEAWMVDRYGEPVRAHIAESKTVTKDWTERDKEAFAAEFAVIEQALAQALASGLPADSAAVRAILRRHHDWVTRGWTSAPNAVAYRGLADLYLHHPFFVARYEGVRPGLSEYLAEAMNRFAAAELA